MLKYLPNSNKKCNFATFLKLKPINYTIKMKKYNFNAGPSMLPREVIEATAKQCLDFNGSGLSLMEISHRAKDFQPVVDEAVALVKELLSIPEGYSVIFLGGGASLEFCMIPYNFLIKKAAPAKPSRSSITET